MKRPRPLHLAAAAAGLLALALSTPPAGAENFGRETGTHEVVTTEILPASDTDPYVFDAAPGWKVSAVAKRVGKGDLAPVLELLAPDGTVVTEEIGIKESKKAAKIKALLLEEGRYALRVSSSAGPGTYRLQFKLRQGKAKKVKVKRDPVGPGALRPYGFAAVDGALVSWTMKWKGFGAPQVVEIQDPDGNPIPVDPALVAVKRNREKAKNVPVHGPGGMYALLVRNDFEDAELTLKIRVKIPKEKKAKVTLSAAEPRLDSVDPAAGGFGVPVTLAGGNLDAAPAAVLIGGNPATDVSVAGGATATATPPTGSGLATILWANADGQVAVLEDAFTFHPPPVVSSFTPEEGPLEGGQALTLQGDGFRASEEAHYRVLLREGEASDVRVESPATITCVTPPGFAGPAAIRVIDRYRQVGATPFTYSYRSAPAIAAVTPSAVPVFGGIEATVTGDGFRFDDEVLLDGVPLDSEPVFFGGAVVAHRLTVPSHARGTASLEVRDRYGQGDALEEGIAFFEFVDATAGAVPAATSTDDWGAISMAAVDMDGDGTLDRILLAHPSALSTTRPGVRVLENDGSGSFTDVTATAMPAPSGEEGFGANAVLAGDLTGDGIPDLYLSRDGTGSEARTDSPASNYVLPWGRVLHADGSGDWKDQPTTGANARFAISGIPHCNICGSGPKCSLFDHDFRSSAAAMGDLDGDLDPDVVLVDDASITRFKGTGTYAIYIGCQGGVQWSNYASYAYGSALRLLSTGSNGGVTDRTKTSLSASFSSADDLRGAAVCVADLDGDFLRDVVVTHDEGLAASDGSPLPATRAFRQKNTGSSVTFQRISGFVPAPAEGDDDWRGDAVAAADLDNDLHGDLVIALDGPPPAGASLSTRVLIQDPSDGRTDDRTAELLVGVLPEGDDGRAAAILARDLDRDGDADLLLSTPDDPGSGGRRTRLLLNVGRDATTGLPIFVDASSILPDPSEDPGGAVALAAADVDGDGDLDLILTDTREAGGEPVRRTRIWKQMR